MYSVYALGDPRTQEIRYIGISQDVHKRFAQHMLFHQGNDKKFAWVNDLRKVNLIPTLTILESDVDSTVIHKREKYWIEQYLSSGASLTNIRIVEKMPKIQNDLPSVSLSEKGLLTSGEAAQYLACKWNRPSYSVDALKMLRHRWKLQPVGVVGNNTLWRKSDLDVIPEPDRTRPRGPRKSAANEAA